MSNTHGKAHCEYRRPYQVRLHRDGSLECTDEGTPVLYRDVAHASRNLPDKETVVVATLVYRSPVREVSDDR